MSMRQRKASISLLADAGNKIEQDRRTSSRDKIEISLLDEYIDSDGTNNTFLVGEINETNTANIKKGIQENGFHGAIDVWRMPEGRYMIFSGHRRTFAMKALGNRFIPCNIYDKPVSEAESRLWYLRANIHTRGSANSSAEGNDIYTARQMQYLADIILMTGEFGGSDKALNRLIAEEFGTSVISVWRYRSMFKMSNRLLEAEAKGYIPLAQAAALSALEQECQDAVLDGIEKAIKYNNPLNRSNIDDIVSRIKNYNLEDELENDDNNSKASYAAAIVSAALESKLTESTDVPDTDNGTVDIPHIKKTYTNKFISNLQVFRNKMEKLNPDELSVVRDELKQLLSEINERVSP